MEVMLKMTKVCPKCKTANDDSSMYCQNCGEKLEESVVAPKEYETKKTGGWWSNQSSGTKFALGLIVLVCIALLLLGMASIFSPKQVNTSINQNNPLTYQGNGILFNYPTSWSIYNPSNTSADELVNLKRTSNGVSLLSISKNNAEGHSLVYWLGVMQSPAKSSDNTLISTKSVTVDGSPGYQLTWRYSSNGGGEQQNTFFIKNNTVYSLLFTTDTTSSIQADIDTIINSFQVTT